MTKQTLEVSPETLAGDMRPFRGRIGITYGLTMIETVFELLYPFAAGLAIDGLLGGEGWVSLMPLAMLWLAHIGAGAVRQLYDTRLFTRLYGTIAAAMIDRQRRAGASTSEVAARSDMARELIEFLEHEVPQAATTLVTLIGSVVMLFVYDLVAGAIMAGLLIPVIVINIVYGRRALRLTVRLNDRSECEVDAIADGRRNRVQAHFRALARWRVLLSNAQVSAWSLVEFLSLVAVLLVLFRVTADPTVQAGAIFAALLYALNIVDAVDTLPDMVEQIARLVDIRRRLEHDATPDADPTQGSRTSQQET